MNFLILCADDYSSEVKDINILLYKSDIKVPEYPFQSKYDSVMQKNKHETDSLLKKHPDMVIDYFPPKPEMYIEIDLLGEISLSEYTNLIKDKISDSLWCMIEFTIEWTGQIREIKLTSYKYQMPDIKLVKEIVKNIQAKPAIQHGFPYPGPFRLMWVLYKKK